MENLGDVICKNCKEVISDESIKMSNKCNEEGEEYGVVEAYCDTCGAEYETSQWGEWESFDEAKEYLRQHIDSRE